MVQGSTPARVEFFLTSYVKKKNLGRTLVLKKFLRHLIHTVLDGHQKSVAIKYCSFPCQYKKLLQNVHLLQAVMLINSKTFNFERIKI
jgi:hypothetical protein